MNDILSPRRAALLAALLSLAPFLSMNGYVGREHDDAQYVLAAQSLAQGHYRHWELPGNLPVTNVTPGLPFLLLPPALALPFQLAAYQIWSTAFLSIALFLAFLWFRRRAPPAEALGVTALLALNPLVLSRAGAVMPEAPGLALGLAALLLWEEDRAGLAGLLCAAACLVRPGALVFPAALGLAALAARDWKKLLKVAGPVLAAVLLWKGWCARAQGISEGLELGIQYAAGIGTVLPRAARFNLASMASTWGSTFLPPSIAAAGGWAGALLILAAAAGAWRRKNLSVGDGALAAGLALHLAWPWWYDRYLLTLLPFLTVRAADALPADKRKVRVLAAVAALQFGLHGHRWLARDVALQPPAHRAAYAWIQERTNPADVFASPFYARDTLYAGRIFWPVPLSDDAGAAVEALDKSNVAYVLWEDVPDVGLSLSDAPTLQNLRAFDGALKDPRLFTTVFTGGGAALYRRVTPPNGPGRPPSP